jgi:hypothetical protein
MSAGWEDPKPGEVGFFIVFFSDLFPGDPGFEDLPREVVCAGCLIEDEADSQLAEGSI